MSQNLTPEQLEAVCCREPDILVEAGAGTGKTSTTMRRYGLRLGYGAGDGTGQESEEEEPLDPGQILVFTFTDKAATELRNRVRDLRACVSDDGDPADGFSMGSAWVGTFHSICARILRSHPILADVDPRFSVLSDVEAERMKGVAYRRALTETTRSRESARLLSGFYPPNLRDGVSNAYAQLRARGEMEPRLPEARPVDLAGAMSEIRSLAREGLGASGLRKPTPERISELNAYLESVTVETVTVEGFEEVRFKSASASIAALVAAIPRFATTLATVQYGEASRDALDRLLLHYGSEYASLKRSIGALDYEDLQLEALKLLREHPGVANIYRERFKEIMVDEFQDTNRLQLDLIAALRGPGTTLFTVGDEMQAIYGFRHADVRLFRSRRMDPDVKVLPLSANFRSQYPVIGAVNLIGHALDEQAERMRDTAAPEERHEFRPLRVGLEPEAGPTGCVEILVTEKKGWDQLDLGPLSPAASPEGAGPSESESAVQAEALAIARHIKYAIDHEGFRPSDVAILFRYRAHKWMYAEALKQVGLKPYIVGGTGFWETQEAIDLKSLLAVVANPLDDDSLLSPLLGVTCGLSSDALWILRRESGFDNPLWPALCAVADGGGPGDFPARDREPAAEFVETVRGIRKRLSTMPLETLVESVATETGYDLGCLLRGGQEALANVRRVASLAGEFEESEGRDLRAFLEWVSVSSEIDSEAAVATEEEDSDVVRLMTVHKAKGLEFEMVCLVELGKRRNGSGEKAFWLGSDPDDPHGEIRFGLQVPRPQHGSFNLYDWDLLREAAERESADEELRLFHVGLTRARRRLVLSGVDKLEPGSGPSLNSTTISRLVAAFSIDKLEPESVEVPAAEPGGGLRAEIPSSVMPIWRNEADDERAAVLRESFDTALVLNEEIAGRPPLHNRPTTRHPDVPLSFTALHGLEDCSASFYATRILKLEGPGIEGLPLDPEEQSPSLRGESTRFGSAVHDLLERSAQRGWLLPTADEVRASLKQHRVKDGDGLLAVRASGMIEGFSDSPLGARVKGGKAEVEVPLLIDILGVTVRGFADLLLRQDDPPLVLDYKSNRLDGTSPGEKMEEYVLQRDLYGLAVARATDAQAVDTAFVFLADASSPVMKTMDGPALEKARTKLEGLVEVIRTGNFFDELAEASPCGDCWACELLASRFSSPPVA